MPQSPIVSYTTSIDPVTGAVTRKVTNLDERKKHQRLKEESSHDRRASAEKALKERTEIEFFERGKFYIQTFQLKNLLIFFSFSF